MSEKFTAKDKKLNKVSDGELEKLSGGGGPIWLEMALAEQAKNNVSAAPAQISGGGGGGGGKNKDKKKKDKKKHK
ncbi:hypothetical protein B1207_15550 [Legionella quinlivanii]|uniref:Uncharacterized protein n=1 Tax=Legionella quinlivanii TaxID=45073 RepID=A0A364LF88_9GAMM|nr:hypothetical protein [Legionella quinlivanii]RAP34536.1 hypothetical protein B1207_15550 [Legionella quinlivanii]